MSSTARVEACLSLPTCINSFSRVKFQGGDTEVESSAVVVIGFTTTKELFPVQIAGTATGLVNIFPFAGGAVFQVLLGYILERHVQAQGIFTLAGYQQAFLVLFFCGIIALLSSLFMKETMEVPE